MWTIVQHPDSPYIRCIGFLYLRYVADPNTLYTKWFQPFLYDSEAVQIEANKNKRSKFKNVGDYIRFLLTDMNYFSTLLPRLPVSIQREVQVKLVMEEEIYHRAKRHDSNTKTMEYFKTISSRVQAMYGDDDNPITWYDAVVDRVLLPTTNDATSYDSPYPKFIVTFPEYGNTETVTLGELDMPNTHNTAPVASSSGYQQSYDDPRLNRQPYDNHYNQQGTIMDRIRKQERDGVTTTQRNQYAKRPMTYKGSLATSTSSNNTRDRRGYYNTNQNDQKRPLSDNTQRDDRNYANTSKPDYQEAREKKRKLLDKYG